MDVMYMYIKCTVSLSKVSLLSDKKQLKVHISKICKASKYNI